LDANFEAPRSPLEESVAEVWTRLLKLDQVGIHDNFFELGGHSLLAAKLISTLRRNLDVKLNLIDVFQSPTVAKQAELIYQRQTENEEDEELAKLLAEMENLSDEEVQQKLAEEIARGGARAHVLKLALLATGSAALEISGSAL
jgi:acyl carrier protein